MKEDEKIKNKKSLRQIILGFCLISLAIIVFFYGLWHMYVFGIKLFLNGFSTWNFKQIGFGFLQIFPIGCWIELGALILARCGYFLFNKN